MAKKRTSSSNRSRKSSSSSSSSSSSRGKSSGSRSGSQGMSTAAKVAIATTAGAVAATAAGFATSEKGRKLRKQVSRKIQDLVDKGSITLKKAGMHHVVEEIESILGAALMGGKYGRNEDDRTGTGGASKAMRRSRAGRHASSR